jgi:hypothetical protein
MVVLVDVWEDVDLFDIIVETDLMVQIGDLVEELFG